MVETLGSAERMWAIVHPNHVHTCCAARAPKSSNVNYIENFETGYAGRKDGIVCVVALGDLNAHTSAG